MKRLDQGLSVGDVDLHALADGHLEPGRHAAVMSHIAAHPDAADRLAGFLRHRAELAALSDQLEDAEPDLQIEALTQRLTSRVFWHRRLRRTVGASALGLVAGVTFASIALTRGGHETAAVTAPAGEIAAAVATLAAVTGADGAPALATPAAGCLIERHPDLQALGLRLVGGDVAPDCSAPTLQLTYRDQAGRPFSLVVSAAGAAGKPATVPVADDGQVAVAWQSGAVRFTLIAPGDSPELLRIQEAAPTAVEATSAEPVPALDAVAPPAGGGTEGTVADPEGGAETLPTPAAPEVLGARAELPTRQVAASSF